MATTRTRRKPGKPTAEAGAGVGGTGEAGVSATGGGVATEGAGGPATGAGARARATARAAAPKVAPPRKPVSEPEIAANEHIRQPECPECGCRHAKQIAAPVELCDGKKIRTRHQCRYCGRTFCFLWEKSEYDSVFMR